MAKEYVVMFVDLESSTQMKYVVGQTAFLDILRRLFKIIGEATGAAAKKSTGDGAMVVFDPSLANPCRSALQAAEKIIEGVDRDNLLFLRSPRVHVRIGIATGTAEDVGGFGQVDLSGTATDLAARLCSEADQDSILLDNKTRHLSKYPDHRFELCTRRLALKGVPPAPAGVSDSYFHLRTLRLVKAPREDHFAKGLLALYADRDALSRDLSPVRWLDLAAHGSTLVVAGRTLIAWTAIETELIYAARSKDLKFQFLIASDRVHAFLEPEQRTELSEDLPRALESFVKISQRIPQSFSLHEVDQLILDGITCAWIRLPSELDVDATVKPKLVVLHDINAAAGVYKASFLLGCTCNKEGERGESWCMAHGLLGRTKVLFEQGSPPRTSNLNTAVQNLIGGSESLAHRSNNPANFATQAIGIFHIIKEGVSALGRVPPPISVQVLLTGRCSTRCVMCNHWSQKDDIGLPLDSIKTLLKDLGEFGVKTVTFSGGEPLMRGAELPELLECGTQNGLRIGLLTNGTIPDEIFGDARRIAESIHKNVSWVAISIDGTEAVDEQIRKPDIIQSRRIARLKEFCKEIRSGPGNSPRISATVTLQKRNIRVNLREVCEFINNELEIERATFKFATGVKLFPEPEYLIEDGDIRDFVKFLWRDRLAQEEGNNLSYLRRCFANEIFTEDDIVAGGPVQSFYRSGKIRCFTPFLFALIDTKGGVYPCCHLYRDNHGNYKSTPHYRKVHKMGVISEDGGGFREIWNGAPYREERRRLMRISPDDVDFYPCGECTRHCQHNSVLTKLFEQFEANPDKVEAELVALSQGDGYVWL
jgi:MoaA/NifB/PqqE/SkfB family radical SAM enzyme